MSRIDANIDAIGFTFMVISVLVVVIYWGVSSL